MTIISKRKAIPSVGNNGNMKVVQNFNNRQVYQKGFVFNTQASTSNNFPVNLSGSARQLYGMTLFFENGFLNDNDTISLSINEENILTDVIWWNFFPSGNNLANSTKRDQYFKIKRSLSGTDTVVLTVKSVNAHKLYPVFFVSNSIESEE